MEKETFERIKPHLNIGTIGHSNHGKTVLTAAILKRQANVNMATAISYADLTKGGVVINPTTIHSVHCKNVEYSSLERHYAHIDCPGLPKYIKNMYDGLNQMDGAILVVDATCGIQAQTREHVILARQAGINQLVVYINKCDEQDDHVEIDRVEQEIRDLLTRYGFEGDEVPVIKGAALPALQGDAKWQESLDELFRALDYYIRKSGSHVNEPFLMNIANIFSVENRIVVMGKIQRGSIQVHDEVELIGVTPTQKTTVIDMEIFKKQLDRGEAGDIISCLLMNGDQINSNQVLAKPGSVHRTHIKIMAEVYALTREEGGRHTPIMKGYKPQFYIGTADITGEVKLPEEVELIMPGDTRSNITIKLSTPIFLEKGMSFVMRDGNATVGTGTITEVLD